MPKCPICKAELEKCTTNGWQCECGELIPFEFAESGHKSCGCSPFNKCR